MTRIRHVILHRLCVGGGTVLVAAVMGNIAWGQLVPPVPAVPDAVKGVTDTAQDAVKDATNSAQEALKDAQDTAKDSQRTVSDSAQDAIKDTTDTVKDAQKDVKKTTQDATKDAKDVTKDAKDSTRNIKSDATKGARDASQNARDAAKDATDDVRSATQDATRNARDAASNATRNARDAASDATRNARDAASDATRNARDAVNNATRDVPDSIDGNARVRGQGSASAAGRANLRGADLGIWFDRSNRNNLVVADVATNAALSAAGFREGDRIVSVAGQNVVNEADFMRYLLNNNARGRMNVVVLRDGQQQTLYVDPSVLNQGMSTAQVEPLETFGIIPDDRINDRIGA